MEITKTNCLYNITDTTESGWLINGTLTKEVSGNSSININISDQLGGHIGNYYYNKTDMINVSYNTKPEYKNDFVTYSEKLIEEVINSIAE